ncbi:MAG: hydrogenase maturation protease [Armatimonadota bacterium]
MSGTIVISLGNPQMRDDGIGTRLVNDLAAEHAGVEFADAGTSGMRVLPLIAHRKKAILVGCVQMSAEPGTIRRFTLDDPAVRNVLAHLTNFHGSLLEILQTSYRQRELPNEVVIFGIEPVKVSPGEGLSPVLEEQLDFYRQLIGKELTT